MPLPPALAARLAKRGLIQSSTSASALRNKENSEGSSSDKPRFVEEVIAESYDDPKASGGGSGPLLANRNRVGASGSEKFQRLGHYGCPNKVNVYHNCTEYCVRRWGRGKVQPSAVDSKRRARMLKKYPLPPGWIEVYDPGTGRYYYWLAESDDVCWTSPTHPRAKIGRSAAEMREKVYEEEQAAAKAMPAPSQSELMKKALRKLKRDRRKEKEELDPMDPAAYSEVPRGTWASGLKNDAVTGVDSTASGPLFQQRPYPSPGDILRHNKKPPPP